MPMFKLREFLEKIFKEVKPKSKGEYGVWVDDIIKLFEKNNITIISNSSTDGDLEFAKKEFYQKISKLRSNNSGNACLKAFDVLNLFIRYAKWDFFPTFGYPKIYYEPFDHAIILRWMRTKTRTIDVILSDNPIIFRIEDDDGNTSYLYTLLYYSSSPYEEECNEDAKVLKSEYEKIRALNWDKIYTDNNSIEKSSFRFDIDVKNNKEGDGISITIKIPDTSLYQINKSEELKDFLTISK